jgi:hypothetical protein
MPPYCSGAGGFGPALTRNIVERRRVNSRAGCHIVRPLAGRAMPISNRITYSRNRAAAQARIPEEIMTLHLFGTYRVVRARRGTLDPFRFPAATARWILIRFIPSPLLIVIEIVIRHMYAP